MCECVCARACVRAGGRPGAGRAGAHERWVGVCGWAWAGGRVRVGGRVQRVGVCVCVRARVGGHVRVCGRVCPCWVMSVCEQCLLCV